jgi:Flp pilus assembly protein TadG
MVVPLLMLILVGLVDFGFAFYTNMTLEYASREGARVASALANGGGTLGCGTGQSPNWQTVDDHAIAAVQRVLVSAGIAVRLDNSDSSKDGVEWIRIYKADANGNGWDTNYNQWTYSAGAGPTVDGSRLNFVKGVEGWRACARSNLSSATAPYLPDAVGVAIRYRKVWNIPLAGQFAGNLIMLDKTVMVLNPTFP